MNEYMSFMYSKFMGLKTLLVSDVSKLADGCVCPVPYFSPVHRLHFLLPFKPSPLILLLLLFKYKPDVDSFPSTAETQEQS